MQETDDSVGFTSLHLSTFSPLGLCTISSGLELCRAATAVLHSISRLKTQFRTRNLPSSLSTNTLLGALWQTSRNVFLQPLLYSFICSNVLGNQVWTIFIARMPARRSSSLCSSALWIAHTWKQREPKALQRQKLLAKNSMHDCSCLSILLATEHRIQEELLSFQTPAQANILPGVPSIRQHQSHDWSWSYTPLSQQRISSDVWGHQGIQKTAEMKKLGEMGAKRNKKNEVIF